jgi:poly-gamma-glutamate synthesis protein (capsule biosynthesis protein)
MLGRYIETLRQRNGGDFPFTYMPDLIANAKEKLQTQNIDLLAGNLEGPIVSKQLYYGDMVFRFHPDVAELLKKAGFNTLGLANNHIFNQTRAGYTETQNYLTGVGIKSFGEPDTANGNSSSIIYDFRGTKLGFLGLNDTDFNLDEAAAIAKIKELKTQVDTLIVSIHWGFEYEKTARESIVQTAHNFVDAGADMIWGHHPHVVQNSEIYNGAPIYYSLGNFVFDQYWSEETQKGLVLAIKIKDNTFTVHEIPIDLVNLGEPKLSASSSQKVEK